MDLSCLFAENIYYRLSKKKMKKKETSIRVRHSEDA